MNILTASIPTSIAELDPPELAEIAEFVEAAAMEETVRAMPAEVVARYGVTARRIGSALAMAMRNVDVPMFNHVVGLGLREPVTDEVLDQVAEAYAGANIRFMVQISPAAFFDELHVRLEERGWPRMDNWVKMIRGAEPALNFETDLRIQTIGPEDAETMAEIATAAFELPTEYAALITGLVGRSGWRHYLAFDAEQPVAMGRLFVHGEVGYMALGATLPSYRGRGAQSALLALRIRDGLEQGCRWFVAETGEDTGEHPNPSYRNMVRAGFELAYLRPNYIYFPNADGDGP